MRRFFVGRALVFALLILALVVAYGVSYMIQDVSSDKDSKAQDSTKEEIVIEDTESTPQEADENDLYTQEELLIASSDLPLDALELHDGFEISVYAAGIDGARSMTLADDGTLYIGTRGEGKVYAIHDRDRDGRADEVTTIASGLNSPNGVAWRDGDLYVAEISRVIRYADIDSQIDAPPEPEVIYSDYPTDAHHGWKFIRFGPDGDLYVPVGAPCNICNSAHPVYASLTRLDVTRGTMSIVAEGIRNTVGFDWHPHTRDLWFTDNGGDGMGDDIPSDELNKMTRQGMHFGYPFCHASGIVDPTHGLVISTCDVYTEPEVELHPHGAALGLRFYTSDTFPERYRDQIFLAEHGSWNRSTPIGYQVSFVEHTDSGYNYEAFVRGWLRSDGTYWGRPVDVQVIADGSLLISDDHAGVIYRVEWIGE